MATQTMLLDVKRLKKFFPLRKGVFSRVAANVKAVDGISFYIEEGETLGLVGESGCGKTTTGRTVLSLIQPTSGSILFRSRLIGAPGGEGEMVDIATAPPKVLKALRREMQIIFQDPYSSLNPRMTAADIVGEALVIHRTVAGHKRQDRVRKLLAAVGLKPDQMRRYPHQFSGGQRQRIAIARALALEPQLVVADEPVSALDVSIQAQVINLLKELQKTFRLTYLFIAHDLSVVKYISNRVAVMYLGKIVESAPTRELFLNPKHPYTEALMSAVPVADPDFKAERITLQGDVPSPVNPPPGCTFHPRCAYAESVCRSVEPDYRDMGDRHFVTCHLGDRLKLRPILF